MERWQHQAVKWLWMPEPFRIIQRSWSHHCQPLAGWTGVQGSPWSHCVAVSGHLPSDRCSFCVPQVLGRAWVPSILAHTWPSQHSLQASFGAWEGFRAEQKRSKPKAGNHRSWRGRIKGLGDDCDRLITYSWGSKGGFYLSPREQARGGESRTKMTDTRQ